MDGQEQLVPIKVAEEWAAVAYEKAAIGHGHGETSKRDVEPHNSQKNSRTGDFMTNRSITAAAVRRSDSMTWRTISSCFFVAVSVCFY